MSTVRLVSVLTQKVPVYHKHLQVFQNPDATPTAPENQLFAIIVKSTKVLIFYFLSSEFYSLIGVVTEVIQPNIHNWAKGI